jgi:hypothetical protein
LFKSPVNQRLFDDAARREGNTSEESAVMTPETDVVIVGARSAGLSAASLGDVRRSCGVDGTVATALF